ncbi:DUF1330 domain-containing protein [Pseudovibrio brasiliensis]|uniref:DUF1330 domain-containing protein n=1 Tax=Pseudovibrio brasiliensis TaxID=1898042 RepID=A0ABX8ANY7_9HYPH|nr:DUF1330 domain-containing protein [Pseudovibrio brasiliensis]QUS56793.1 DUF1330 domain-containing protein [Pseudovibrio brasiliensis]
MSVLNFSYATIKNMGQFQQYVQAAAALMEEAGVEVIVRGKFSQTKRGDELLPHIAAVFRYKDLQSLEDFYTSVAYKKIIPLRDEACEMTIQVYEE